MGELPGSHQYQPGKPHIFHRPRRSTDIAGVRGVDQYYADIGAVQG
jgi:hypothetical protein